MHKDPHLRYRVTILPSVLVVPVRVFCPAARVSTASRPQPALLMCWRTLRAVTAATLPDAWGDWLFAVPAWVGRGGPEVPVTVDVAIVYMIGLTAC